VMGMQGLINCLTDAFDKSLSWADNTKGVSEFEITISGWLVSPPPNPIKIFLEVT